MLSLRSQFAAPILPRVPFHPVSQYTNSHNNTILYLQAVTCNHQSFHIFPSIFCYHSKTHSCFIHTIQTYARTFYIIMASSSYEKMYTIKGRVISSLPTGKKKSIDFYTGKKCALFRPKKWLYDTRTII